MRKLGSWVLAACFWLVTGVLGALAVLLAVASDHTGESIACALKEHQRFYACFILSSAIGGNALWLVPNHGLAVGVCAATVVGGVVIGVFWESRT